MCWKFEWAKAYNNITWAIRHMKRTRKKKHVEKYPKAVDSTELVITPHKLIHLVNQKIKENDLE